MVATLTNMEGRMLKKDADATVETMPNPITLTPTLTPTPIQTQTLTPTPTPTPTPTLTLRRGCQLSLRVQPAEAGVAPPSMRALESLLRERGVSTDAREPDIVRTSLRP